MKGYFPEIRVNNKTPEEKTSARLPSTVFPSKISGAAYIGEPFLPDYSVEHEANPKSLNFTL